VQNQQKCVGEIRLHFEKKRLILDYGVVKNLSSHA
jgi:hypothetical protein